MPVSLVVTKPNRATAVRGSGHRVLGPDRGGLEVRMFNVGDGEAILLEFPGKTAWLVDGGSSNSKFRNRDLAGYLVKYLIEQRLTLTAAVASHPHVDHIGTLTYLLPALARRTSPVAYYYSGVSLGKKGAWLVELEAVVERLKKEGKVMPVSLRDRHREVPIANGVEAHLFAGSGQGAYTSVFLHLHFGEASLLFTGDSKCKYEKALLAAYGREDFRADVLKVTHHGSSTGTARSVVDAVKPAIVIASTSVDEGHTLEPDVWNDAKGKGRLGPPQRKLETLRDGDIILRTEGKRIQGGILYEVETDYPGRFAGKLRVPDVSQLEPHEPQAVDQECLS